MRGIHMCRQSAASIKPKLEELRLSAHDVDMALFKKLENELRRVRDKNSGYIQSKKYLLDYLLELTKDIELYLALKKLDLEDRTALVQKLSRPELFWFQELFPRWIESKNDEKYLIWRPKLPSKVPRDDEIFIKLLNKKIEEIGGECLWRHIIDFSMATDLIVCHRTDILSFPLCVQLTVSKEITEKKRTWEITLRRWNIERGLFISLKPSKDDVKLEQIARTILNRTYVSKCRHYEILSI
jgi:hypothetical protein